MQTSWKCAKEHLTEDNVGQHGGSRYRTKAWMCPKEMGKSQTEWNREDITFASV